MKYVLDASAWLRCALKDGPAYEAAASAILHAPDLTDELHAPQHWTAEVGHVLHRSRLTGRLTSREAMYLLERMLSLPVQYHSIPALTPAAFQLAWKHRLSVYDALYLALAIGTRSRLLTVDDDLAHAARLEGCA